MDDWGSHVPALAAAVANTTGNMLELGCGDYSTPLIHALRGERFVLSAEHDAKWLERFANLHQPGAHHVIPVPDWDAFLVSQGVAERPWGLIICDHAPGDRRAPDLRALANLGEVVLAHDTDASCYGWGDVWRVFSWVYTYQRWETWTTIAGWGKRPSWPERLTPGTWGPTQPWR